jgi:hypothetical protein
MGRRGGIFLERLAAFRRSRHPQVGIVHEDILHPWPTTGVAAVDVEPLPGATLGASGPLALEQVEELLAGTRLVHQVDGRKPWNRLRVADRRRPAWEEEQNSACLKSDNHCVSFMSQPSWNKKRKVCQANDITPQNTRPDECVPSRTNASANYWFDPSIPILKTQVKC